MRGRSWIISFLMAAIIFISLPCPSYGAISLPGLAVQVSIDGKVFPLVQYSISELHAMEQKDLFYSSMDSSENPSVIAAQGLALSSLFSNLGIKETEVQAIILDSSDGWHQTFASSDYLQKKRYYYPKIIENSEAGPIAIPPILALRSYEGRMQAKPDRELMTDKNGIRFCFGQSSLKEAVSIKYGKYIEDITIVLAQDTTFVPPSSQIDKEEKPPEEDPSPPPLSPEGIKQNLPAEDGNKGLIADTLTITVGYYGGPYHLKKVFTLDELYAMNPLKQPYTFIDNMPAVVLDSVVGVKLADILKAAGIDVNSIESFHFYCSDVQKSWYQSINKQYLLDTIRYYYPQLPQCWDAEEGIALQGATDNGVVVETVISLEENWCRFGTAADFSHLTAESRFRLAFGQTDTKTSTASRSARWIHTIEVMLGGTADKNAVIDKTVLSQEVGSQYQQTEKKNMAPKEGDMTKADIAKVDLVGKKMAENGKNLLRKENGDAGVQNWRVYEMAETARELPLSPPENEMGKWTMLIGALFFLLGIAVTAIIFHKEVNSCL